MEERKDPAYRKDVIDRYNGSNDVPELIGNAISTGWNKFVDDFKSYRANVAEFDATTKSKPYTSYGNYRVYNTEEASYKAAEKMLEAVASSELQREKVRDLVEERNYLLRNKTGIEKMGYSMALGLVENIANPGEFAKNALFNWAAGGSFAVDAGLSIIDNIGVSQKEAERYEDSNITQEDVITSVALGIAIPLVGKGIGEIKGRFKPGIEETSVKTLQETAKTKIIDPSEPVVEADIGKMVKDASDELIGVPGETNRRLFTADYKEGGISEGYIPKKDPYIPENIKMGFAGDNPVEIDPVKNPMGFDRTLENIKAGTTFDTLKEHADKNYSTIYTRTGQATSGVRKQREYFYQTIGKDKRTNILKEVKTISDRIEAVKYPQIQAAKDKAALSGKPYVEPEIELGFSVEETLKDVVNKTVVAPYRQNLILAQNEMINTFDATLNYAFNGFDEFLPHMPTQNTIARLFVTGEAPGIKHMDLGDGLTLDAGVKKVNELFRNSHKNTFEMRKGVELDERHLLSTKYPDLYQQQDAAGSINVKPKELLDMFFNKEKSKTAIDNKIDYKDIHILTREASLEEVRASLLSESYNNSIVKDAVPFEEIYNVLNRHGVVDFFEGKIDISDLTSKLKNIYTDPSLEAKHTMQFLLDSPLGEVKEGTVLENLIEIDFYRRGKPSLKSSVEIITPAMNSYKNILGEFIKTHEALGDKRAVKEATELMNRIENVNPNTMFRSRKDKPSVIEKLFNDLDNFEKEKGIKFGDQEYEVKVRGERWDKNFDDFKHDTGKWDAWDNRQSTNATFVVNKGLIPEGHEVIKAKGQPQFVKTTHSTLDMYDQTGKVWDENTLEGVEFFVKAKDPEGNIYTKRGYFDAGTNSFIEDTFEVFNYKDNVEIQKRVTPGAALTQEHKLKKAFSKKLIKIHEELRKDSPYRNLNQEVKAFPYVSGENLANARTEMAINKHIFLADKNMFTDNGRIDPLNKEYKLKVAGDILKEIKDISEVPQGTFEKVIAPEYQKQFMDLYEHAIGGDFFEDVEIDIDEKEIIRVLSLDEFSILYYHLRENLNLTKGAVDKYDPDKHLELGDLTRYFKSGDKMREFFTSEYMTNKGYIKNNEELLMHMVESIPKTQAEYMTFGSSSYKFKEGLKQSDGYWNDDIKPIFGERNVTADFSATMRNLASLADVAIENEIGGGYNRMKGSQDPIGTALGAGAKFANMTRMVFSGASEFFGNGLFSSLRASRFRGNKKGVYKQLAKGVVDAANVFGNGYELAKSTRNLVNNILPASKRFKDLNMGVKEKEILKEVVNGYIGKTANFKDNPMQRAGTWWGEWTLRLQADSEVQRILKSQTNVNAILGDITEIHDFKKLNGELKKVLELNGINESNYSGLSKKLTEIFEESKIVRPEEIQSKLMNLISEGKFETDDYKVLKSVKDIYSNLMFEIDVQNKEKIFSKKSHGTIEAFDTMNRLFKNTTMGMAVDDIRKIVTYRDAEGMIRSRFNKQGMIDTAKNGDVVLATMLATGVGYTIAGEAGGFAKDMMTGSKTGYQSIARRLARWEGFYDDIQNSEGAVEFISTVGKTAAFNAYENSVFGVFEESKSFASSTIEDIKKAVATTIQATGIRESEAAYYIYETFGIDITSDTITAEDEVNVTEAAVSWMKVTVPAFVRIFDRFKKADTISEKIEEEITRGLTPEESAKALRMFNDFQREGAISSLKNYYLVGSELNDSLYEAGEITKEEYEDTRKSFDNTEALNESWNNLDDAAKELGEAIVKYRGFEGAEADDLKRKMLLDLEEAKRTKQFNYDYFVNKYTEDFEGFEKWWE